MAILKHPSLAKEYFKEIEKEKVMDQFELYQRRIKDIEGEVKNRILTNIELDIMLKEAPNQETLIERVKDLVRNA